MNEPLGEELIHVWLRMSGALKNNRLIASMTFNEIFVCNILYQQKLVSSERMTATEVGEKTKLLKSQMNKIISNLEKQGLVERIRSSYDKRKVYLQLKDENLEIYLNEHERVLQMLEQLIHIVGKDKIVEAVGLMNEITDAMETIIVDPRKESHNEYTYHN